MSSPQTLDEAVDWLRKHYQAEPARGLQVRYVVELSGAAGGVIAMAIEDGELRLAKAPEPRPDVRLRLAAEDWFGILGGRENVEPSYWTAARRRCRASAGLDGRCSASKMIAKSMS